MTITRFAPSPTGYLHIGGLRTALYSYLWAKKNGGKFLLRIEDTDLKRNSQEAVDAIEEAFKWTSLSHDGEVIFQSKRFDLYKEYIQKLLDEDKAYYCYMSRQELDEMREEQQAKKERPRYNGKYRDFKGTPPEGITPVVRIKAPQDGKIEFVDGIKGEISFNVSDILDDFIIARGDGTPTYNFVVAIDDALMNLTSVIRGDDHLSNTPKQIVVYNALNFEIPTFYHVPMILNPQGKKLSKRDGATDVMEYKSMGYLPEALLNFLIRLGWSHGDQELFSMDEMLEFFDPKDINRSASAYNAEKLLWINAQYIKELPFERIEEDLKFFGTDISQIEKKELLVNSLRERAKTLKEFAQMVENIITPPTEYVAKAVKKFVKEPSKEILKNYLNHIKDKKESLQSEDEFEKVTKEFLEENDLKLKDIAQLLRLSMVGSAVSPSIFAVLSVVGIDEVITRIEAFLKFLERE
jgi:glutamyl-tRNA synthetase